MKRLIGTLLMLAAPPTYAQAKPTHIAVVLDQNGNVQSFYGVPVTLTRSGLKRLPFPVKQGYYYGEGGRYPNYTITAQRGVRVVAEFKEDGTLDEAESTSPNAVGPKGVGVGSTLGDVRRAWPGGIFFHGFAEGEHATYTTGSNVRLSFNPGDLPPGAYDPTRPDDFPIPDTIRVTKISISRDAHPIPKGTQRPDQNKNYAESKSGDGKVSRLDVERTPGTFIVRLIWSRQGTVESDHVIDVSKIPDFDIWGRDIVRDSDPVIIAFRYGNFKDCRDDYDDRDSVFVTLGPNEAAISRVLPPGVKFSGGSSPPKYLFVGKSMKSAAHGCRRTYDPVTGKFGLEKVQ